MNSKFDFDFVFCVGMRRGGSTLQTQLTSAILNDAPMHLVTPDSVGGFIASHPDSNTTRVVKAHKFMPEVVELLKQDRAKVVYVYRDLRDVVGSIVLKYELPPFSFVHGGLARLLDENFAWTSVEGIYVTSYEKMISNIAQEATRLAEYLNVPLSDARAVELANKFDVSNQREMIQKSDCDQGAGANRYDRSTLLHANHIQSGGSGGFREVLAAREIAALEWQMRTWMKSHGYRSEYAAMTQLLAHLSFKIKSFAHQSKMLFSGGSRKTSAVEQESID